MKKVLSILLCAVLLLSLAMPAMATSSYIVFTADSRFVEGCTVVLDKGKTLMNFYDRGTSDTYNAFLEGFAKYWWFCNDEFYAHGEEATFSSEDVGKQFELRVYLYRDAELTDYIDVFCSDLFTVAKAGEAQIVFTADSSCTVGGTLKVDKAKTMDSIIAHAKSEIYNAYLDGNVQYFWFRDGVSFTDGDSYTVKQSDIGSRLQCYGYLFSDTDRTQQVGVIKSPVYTVSGTKTLPQITTQELETGVLGTPYYQKLECTNPDVTFSLFRSSLPEGLYLTQHGEIEGTPTKAGSYYVVIMVTDEFGTENTAEFELTISAGPLYSIEITRLPDKLVYTAGEKLDMTGLRVRIYTPDGYLDLKDGDRLTYSKETLVTLGEQKIKLSYEDAFEFFIVTVVAAPEEPTEAPTEATEDPTEATEATKPEQGTEKPTKDNHTDTNKIKDKNTQTDAADGAEEKGLSMESVLFIVLGILVVIGGSGITFLCVAKKQKNR